MRLPTLGGKQFWTDHLHRGKWRIQRKANSNTFRLLDSKNFRVIQGDWEACLAKLPQSATSNREHAKHLVIVLHGLIRTRFCMGRLCRHLERNGLTTINMSYASVSEPVEKHAAALDLLIRHLPESCKISFAAHSLGNIVVRHWLHNHVHAELQNRLSRMIMLGPPNQGSSLATRFANWWLFRKVFGPCGQQLGVRWAETEKHLSTPQFEFAIIAGGNHWVPGNPLIGSPNDQVVTADETNLEGARFQLVKPLIHTTMMRNKFVCQAATKFLLDGVLESE